MDSEQNQVIRQVQPGPIANVNKCWNCSIEFHSDKFKILPCTPSLAFEIIGSSCIRPITAHEKRKVFFILAVLPIASCFAWQTV